MVVDKIANIFTQPTNFYTTNIFYTSNIYMRRGGQEYLHAQRRTRTKTKKKKLEGELRKIFKREADLDPPFQRGGGFSNAFKREAKTGVV
jgi:hypothetical protein